MTKNNIKQNRDMNTFYKTYRATLFDVLSHPDLPLWIKVLNHMILEVEFEKGYVSTSFIKQLARFYQTKECNISRAIKKLIENNWILKYPFGCKRAKGYMLNPERFWVGCEESKNEKIAIYRKAMNKLQIDIDITGETEVEVNMIERDKLAKYTSNYKDLAS